MTKFLMTAIALVAFSAQAHAVNLTGTWTGSGNATDHQGKNISCESVVITIAHSDASLQISSSFTCEGNKIAVPGRALAIKGGALFDGANPAGSISANSVKILAKDRTYAMNTDASFTDSSMNIGAVIALASNPSAPVLSFKGNVSR